MAEDAKKELERKIKDSPPPPEPQTTPQMTM